MTHSRFDVHRTHMIAGVKYVPTLVRVLSKHDDGEPRTVEIPRVDDLGRFESDMVIVYLPAAWARGAGRG